MVPGHRLELLGLPDPAGVLPELVAEHVGDMGEVLLPTDRARPVGLLTVAVRVRILDDPDVVLKPGVPADVMLLAQESGPDRPGS